MHKQLMTGGILRDLTYHILAAQSLGLNRLAVLLGVAAAKAKSITAADDDQEEVTPEQSIAAN